MNSIRIDGGYRWGCMMSRRAFMPDAVHGTRDDVARTLSALCDARMSRCVHRVEAMTDQIDVYARSGVRGWERVATYMAM